MSIRHHPSTATILDYAAGSAPRGRALVLAMHFDRCPECRAELAACEAVGGALLNELPPAEMAPDALEKALSALDLPAPTVAYASDDRATEDWLANAPAEVRQAYEHNRRWFAPGVWVAHLDRPKGSKEKSYLLGVGPGIAVPHHSHRGVESTCVLKGEFVDRKQRFGVGDYAEVDEETEHRPITSKAGECVCLIAADGPLVPLDMMGRLFQPLAGI
jgi:putative transcriptional regulator